MMRVVLCALALLAAQTPSRPGAFQSPYSLDQMRQKQAVVETTLGTFVVELLPDAAPNHVGHFMKVAREGGYTGTIFHRVMRDGIIQGGDPLSRDASKAAQYGTGGLNELKAEFNAQPKTAGAVGAVLQPGKPDSGGYQFFVIVTDRMQLDGQYTIFGRVVDGLDVVQRISAIDADAAGRPVARIAIAAVTIRDTPPPKPVPFAADTAATLSSYRAVLETTKGSIELEFLADLAPETVRNFLRLADAGVYDGVTVHRVVPGFVIQTGSLAFRPGPPLTADQYKLVHNLAPEFSRTPNVPGIVSMARGDDPGSATTSFFICTGECRALDGQYAVFARVTAGMDVVKAIEGAPVDGETPKEPVTVLRVKISKRSS